MKFIKEFILKYWKTLLFFAAVGLVGGFVTGLYLLDSYPAELRAQLVAELEKLGVLGAFVEVFLGIITAVQSLLYGVALGALGIFLGERSGLWKNEIRLEKKPILFTAGVAVMGGILMILLDLLWFGKAIPGVMESYATKPTADYIIACVSYGAVIEEVILRLFAMSLVAFVLMKLMKRDVGGDNTLIFVAANVTSSLMFALLHIPMNIILFGGDAIVIIRCILMNGALGLLFGYLYRKYGLRYSMIAHGGVHIVSKLIWVLFI